MPSDDQLLATAVHFLAEGQEVEAANILRACSLIVKDCGARDYTDDTNWHIGWRHIFHVAILAPRASYDILCNEEHPVSVAVRRAIEAVLPSQPYDPHIEQYTVRAKLIAPASKSELSSLEPVQQQQSAAPNSVLDAEERTHLEALLAQYRSNLRKLEGQAAQYGGDSYAPIHVTNQIDESRRQIAEIQLKLTPPTQETTPPAFADLTDKQRQLLIQIVRELQTGTYHSEFFGTVSFGREWDLHLERKGGGEGVVVEDIEKSDLEALQEGGYIRLTFKRASYTGSLTRKASQEYNRLSSESQ